MTDASAGPASAGEITRLLEEVDKHARHLGHPRDAFLDVDLISYRTGVERDRVRELLDGAPPQEAPGEPEEARKAFRTALIKQRLALLLRTRPKATPKGPQPYGVRELARATGISSQHISNLLHGARGANADHAARLEEFFFGRANAFCTRTEGAAMVEFLQQVAEVELPLLRMKSALRELGAESVALRSVRDGERTEVLKDLLPAFEALVLRQRVPGAPDAAGLGEIPS
ncbi:helix-turn-helix transcriptional regulator [Streptomyces sp. NPDC002004]